MVSDGGKGSSPRPFSVDRETFESNWDKIFKNEDNTGIDINEYQDILSTEDCVLDALEEISLEVEQRPYKAKATGSIPVSPTNKDDA